MTAELGRADFNWLDGLRRQHYPPERNRVPAHLTLFRTLPPSSEGEVRRSLARAASAPGPEASIVGAMDLDSGVALRVRSDDLRTLRDELAEDFHGLLTFQDLGRWTPHVTIQNKAERTVARALLESLRDFEPRPLQIGGLEIARYCDGLWEPLARYRFRGG